jgi:hypothetical protein
MDSFYNVLAFMVLTVLVLSTFTFGYFGWHQRRPLASCFAWICCGVYFGVTAMAFAVFFG